MAKRNKKMVMVDEFGNDLAPVEKVPSTAHVLVPLPSLQLSECKNNSYIKTNQLSQKSYDEIVTGGKDLLKRIKATHPQHINERLLCFGNTAILRSLGKNDVLYVVAHGAPVGIGSKSDEADLTALTLAKSLQEAGLSQELRTIKIMACDSAIGETTMSAYGNISDSFRPNLDANNHGFGRNKSFAENLSGALQKLGYEKLDVVGYLGETLETQNKHAQTRHSLDKERNHSWVKHGQSQVRASRARFFFLSKKSDRDAQEIAEKNNSTLSDLNFSNSF